MFDLIARILKQSRTPKARKEIIAIAGWEHKAYTHH
nr:MAG TPA: hypothetical protein [Caudoviricetes sp.]